LKGAFYPTYGVQARHEATCGALRRTAAAERR
jgi:hypothetical protein